MFKRFFASVLAIALFTSTADAATYEQAEHSAKSSSEATSISNEIVVAQRGRRGGASPWGKNNPGRPRGDTPNAAQRRIERQLLREKRTDQLREQRQIRQEKLRDARAQNRLLRQRHREEFAAQKAHLREEKLRANRSSEQADTRNAGTVASLAIKPLIFPKHLHERLTSVSRLALRPTTNTQAKSEMSGDGGDGPPTKLRLSLGALKQKLSLIQETRAPPKGGLIIDKGKYKYIFGHATSNPSNFRRSVQNKTELDRVGVRNTHSGRIIIQRHLEETISNESNIIEKFTREINNVHMRFEVRESLLRGPGGFLKTRSTFEVLPNGDRRFITIIPQRAE